VQRIDTENREYSRQILVNVRFPDFPGAWDLCGESAVQI